MTRYKDARAVGTFLLWDYDIPIDMTFPILTYHFDLPSDLSINLHAADHHRMVDLYLLHYPLLTFLYLSFDPFLTVLFTFLSLPLPFMLQTMTWMTLSCRWCATSQRASMRSARTRNSRVRSCRLCTEASSRWAGVGQPEASAFTSSPLTFT